MAIFRTCVVFDEAHNIDNVCIESMSVAITQKNIDRAAGELVRYSCSCDRNTLIHCRLDEAVQQAKRENAARLQEEYEKLVEGLRK